MVFRRKHLHLRSRCILRQLLGKSVQLLECFKTGNRPSIFDTVAKEGRQDLDLLSGEELRRQSLNHCSEVGNGFPADNRVFIVDILSQGLNNFDQRRLLTLDLFNAVRRRVAFFCGPEGLYLGQFSQQFGSPPAYRGPRPA